MCSAWNVGALIVSGVDALVVIIISGIGVWPHCQAWGHLSDAERALRRHLGYLGLSIIYLFFYLDY